MKIIPPEERVSRNGPTGYFTGSVIIDDIAANTDPSRLNISRVSFAPGARTAWHNHPISQVLYVLSGIGRVQKAGKPIQTLKPGDTVLIEAGEKHWHGASPKNLFVHIAIQEIENGTAVTWLEPVTDEEYLGDK